MQQADKQIRTSGATETGTDVQTFTFPKAGGKPVVIRAKTLEEATKILEAQEKKSQSTTTTKNNG